MILVLFGLPGVGKTYLGAAIAAEMAIPFYDADDDLPTDFKHAIVKGKMPAMETRDRFREILLARIESYARLSDDLVVAQSLPRNSDRIAIIDRYSSAKLCLLSCVDDVRIGRLSTRKHWLKASQARRTEAAFEEPSVPHFSVDNSQNGLDRAKAQISAIVSGLLRDEANR